jgi:hypothetical protein
MMRLEMNIEETDLLRRVLDSYVSNLRTEIHHTDNREYREALKHEDEVLRSLLQRLDGQQARASAY